MALRNIVLEGDGILRKKSFPVTEFNNSLHILLDDMKETLLKENGAGLAAVQVGVLKRAVLINVEDGFYELINPVITREKGSQTGFEGCLSIKDKYGTVTRPNEVRVNAFDRYGKPFTLTATGFFARAVCHELDHLDGKLYIDIAESMENS